MNQKEYHETIHQNIIVQLRNLLPRILLLNFTIKSITKEKRKAREARQAARNPKPPKKDDH